MPTRHYVVQTHPRKEQLAARELRNQDFEVFLPVIRRRPLLKRGRFEDRVPAPLFPKYLFVALDLEADPWSSVNGTRGVLRLLQMDDERPSPVPLAAMDRLLAAGEVLEEPAAALPFNVNDTVELIEGPLKGLRAVVQLCAADRVTLLLSLLGGQVQTTRCAPRALRYVPAGT